jgi:hypothetical protein|tara:strand:+ start:35 stop:178 length:144 start_codon:yes stop_codon:yes gene_type:complete
MGRKEIVRGVRMCLADMVQKAEMIDGISARYIVGNEVYKIRVERESK